MRSLRLHHFPRTPLDTARPQTQFLKKKRTDSWQQRGEINELPTVCLLFLGVDRILNADRLGRDRDGAHNNLPSFTCHMSAVSLSLPWLASSS